MMLPWRTALALVAGVTLLVACSSTTATTPPAGMASAPGYHPGKFVWHDLVTRDPAAARRFYGPLLGWEFEDTTRNGKPYAVARVGGQPVAGIVVHPDESDEPALWLSYLSVPDVDEAVKKAVDAGHDMTLGPVQICAVCGYTAEGDAPDKCPVCAVAKDQFKTFA